MEVQKYVRTSYWNYQPTQESGYNLAKLTAKCKSNMR